MASKRLFAFTGFLLAVAALIWACSDDSSTPFDPNGVGGFGGVGPFTGMGGLAAVGGDAGATATDAGEGTVARDDLFEVGAVAPTTIPAPGLLANDTLGGAALPAGNISTRLGGRVELHEDGSFVYTPPADPGALPRLDNFSYTLQAEGGEFSANVGLGLVAPPLASDDEFGVLPDDTLFLDPPGVLVNDQPNGATISAFDATSSEGGLVVLTQDGALTYSPPSGFTGDDSFSYTLSNLTGSATAVVHISVDELPAAAEDHFIGSKGEVLSPAGSLLDNDARGAPLASIVSFGGGSLGGTVADHAAGTSAAAGDSQLTVTTSGAVTFTPASSLVGPFEFFYRLQNSAGVSEARVVLDLHERAFAQDDTFAVAAGATLHATANGEDSLLANDVGTPAPVITSFGGGSLGGTVADHAVGSQVEFSGCRLTVNADGSFTFVAGLDASGEFSFDYQIGNDAGQDEGTVHLVVSHAPEITSAETLVLHAGSDQNLPFQLTATGTPTPVITIDGELPAGVTFAGDSLNGTADVDSAGNYDVTVTASNGTLPDAVQTLTITVQTEALIVGAPSTTFTVGVAGSYAPLVVGVPTPLLTLDGDLPQGLAFDTETGVISGTPAPGTGGVYSISITADSSLAGDSILLVSLEVIEAPAITSAASHTLVVGQSSSFPITTTGRPTASLSVSGVLPAGVSLLDGALTGTPAQGSGGTYHVTLGATNGVSPNASQSLELTVNEAPELSGAPQAHFTVGSAGSYVLSSSGFPAPTLSVTGSLPSGLSFDTQTGTLSGTPAASTGGTHSLTFGADNGVGSPASLTVSLIIDEGSLITSASSTSFTVGTAGTFTVTTGGTPAPTLSLTGTLPAGLTFTPATGVLAGTPAPGTGGLYGLTFGATNGVGSDSSQSFALTVIQPPTVNGASSATFRVGTAGLYSPVVTGFPAPALSVTGTLPDGISFDPLTGALSGTPEPGSGGSYELSIETLGVALPLTLEVEEPSEITSDDATTFRVGTAGSFNVTATGFPAPEFEFDEELPSGLTFSAETGVLEGTPAPGSGGEYTLTLSADNDISAVAVQTFTLTIEEAAGISGAASTTFVVGTAGSYGVLRSGFPSSTLSLTGTLPAGLSFDASTGTISGTAQSGSAGNYSLNIHAANGIGSGANLSVTVHVQQAAAITSASSTTFTVGTASFFGVTTTGTPAPTVSATGSLPTGVTLSSAGLLSGAPAAGTGGTYPLTLQANNGVGSAASQSFTLTVNQAAGISGASTKTFTVGVASSYTPTATGFPAPSFSLTGSLPSGLSFSPTTGVISGTALGGSGGSYPVTINADNGVGTVANLPVAITVQELTTITSANSTTFTVGSPGSFTVTTTGTPAPTLGVTGSLPTGVTFNSGTGVLSGTPASGTGGAYSLTFSANNGVGSPASQSFTLTVNQAAGISGASSTTFTVGVANSYTPTATGFPAPSFSLTGSLPSGLSFSTSTGAITGTAQAGTGGSYPVTINASNGIGATASLGVTVNVSETPAITSANSTTFTVGSPGSFTVTATGTPAPTLGVTGSLPSGVTFNAGTGVLSGTPASGTGGAYSPTFSANNGVGSPASQSFTLTVNQAAGISGASSKTFTVGVADSYAPTATGFPAPSFSLTGSLPSGLSFSTSTGAITGTASSGSGGAYPVTINASNGIGATASLSVTFNVSEAPAITSANSTTFTAGSAGSFSLTATGTPSPSLGVTGSLPSGVTFSTATGLLSGTPAGGTGGTYPLTFSASNGVGSAASQSFTLTVRQAPSISGAPPSPADVDAAYSHAFTSGGFPAPAFSVLSGSLPTGLTLNSGTGVLSGTPSAAGTFSNITVRAQNAVGNADITFTIVVNVAVPPPSATGESFAVTGNIPIDVTSSVLSNDTLNGASITGFGVSLASAASASPGGTLTTTGGGSVTLAADGTFSYDPPAGTTGSDSFAYTIANAGGSATAQVSLTISNRVWFVNSGAAGGGSGKATSPYTDLPSVGAGSSGDAIYVLRGSGTYSAKTLSANQRLIGQGVTVNSTHLGFSLAPFARSSVFGTAGANTVMRTLTLANSSYVRGMDISAVAGQRGLVGASTSSLDISGMAVTASNAAAVDLSSTGGSVSLTSVTGTGGTNAILISSNTGSFTVNGDGSGLRNGSGGTLSSTTSDAVMLSSAQNITLRSMNLQNISASAVRGIIVNNFTAQSLAFSNIGTGLDFDENVTGNANLSGVVSVTNSSFDTATGKFVSLLNFSGTISSFTFDNNTFANNASNATDFLVWDSAAITSMSIKSNTYTNTGNTLSANAIQVYLGRVASATSTPFARVDVDSNVITGTNGTGIRLRVQDSNGTLQTKVINNSVTGMTSSGFTQGIRIEAGTSTGDSTVCAQISGNTSVFSNGGIVAANGGIGVRRQSGSGGTNDTFGIVGLPAGSATCPVSGTATCAATPAIENFINGLNPSGNGGYLVSATTGFSSCTLP